MPDDNAPASNTGNVVSIVLGVLLFVGVLAFKYFAPGKVAVGFSDVLLLALPVLLWLLASGQLESLKVGTSGFQIKSAILKATGTPINLKIKKINYSAPVAVNKEGLAQLTSFVASRPEALALAVKKTAYYDEYVLREYIQGLSNSPSFKYFLFFDGATAQTFLGGIGASDFLSQLDIVGATAAGQKLALGELVSILNGGAAFAKVGALRGFVKGDQALKKSDNAKTALTRMNELGTTWLPVTERAKFLGTVDQSSLAASLLLDVADAIGAVGTRRS